MHVKEESTLPRIHVKKMNGKVTCLLDDKLQQRYGRVLLKNNKQGRHLFGISYCIASLAAKYYEMTDDEIRNDIVSRFHPNFLTMIVINAKFLGTETHFLNDWEFNCHEIKQDYGEIKSSPNGDLDLFALQNYLNIVGAMLHTFPCNVAYADNASDPAGGYHSKQAMSKINLLMQRDATSMTTNGNIALTLDRGVIEELFGKGFNQNNSYVLAFMIMQIRELQFLQDSWWTRESFFSLNNSKIESDLRQIAFQSGCKVPMADISLAVSNANNIIKAVRREILLKLEHQDHHGIRNMISSSLDRLYNCGQQCSPG